MTDVFKKSMEFHGLVRDYIAAIVNPESDLMKDDFAKLALCWRGLFVEICLELGLKKKASHFLYRELVYGNWDRLHPTWEEEYNTLSDWLHDFAAEIFYCSDRWTFDRLTRCHWYFRQAMNVVGCDVNGEPRNI